MLGLVNRAIEEFVRGNYGETVWETVTGDGALPSTFEHLLDYHPETVERLIAASVRTLNKPREDFLEDLGHYLIADERCQAPRRLLRFGGATFSEFLSSLEEVPGRLSLAFPGLELGSVETSDGEDGEVFVRLRSDFADAACFVMGMLRALADDYGALATVDMVERSEDDALLRVAVRSAAHAPGRNFSLSQRAVG